MISISSSVGNSFSRSDLVAWSKQSGVHRDKGMVKPCEDESTLNFDSIPVNTVSSRPDPSPCSNRVASFSPVYIQAGRARNWRRGMHFDRKSNSTIIDIKPCSAKNWILFNMGR
jgi:hypothetical protein